MTMIAHHKSCLFGRGFSCLFIHRLDSHARAAQFVQIFAFSMTKALYWQVRKRSIFVLKGTGYALPVAVDLVQ